MPNVRIRIEKSNVENEDLANQQDKLFQKQRERRIAIASTFASQMVNQGKEMIRYSLSRYGDRTGDYVKQSNINESLEILGSISNIAGGFVTSVATMNPIPAIMSAISTTIKISQNLNDKYYTSWKAEKDRQLLLARSGNGTTNGSRGTEN